MPVARGDVDQPEQIGELMLQQSRYHLSDEARTELIPDLPSSPVPDASRLPSAL